MVTKTRKPTPVIHKEEEIEDSDEFITFRRSHFYSVLVVLAFATGLLVGFVAWGRGTTTVTAAAPAPAAAAAAQQPAGPVQAAPVTPESAYKRYDIPTDGYPSLGPADAKIVIVEFSDFQCPFCRRFHQDTYKALLDAYPGQIRFVYRNLPLTQIHPFAMGAAVAALCANDQNVFWDYHDKLFSSETLGDDTYVQYATDLGLDLDKFKACLTSGTHDDFIKQDMDYSLSIGVQSTPTFFVNGLAIIGAQPLSSFQQLIDQELAGKIPG